MGARNKAGRTGSGGFTQESMGKQKPKGPPAVMSPVAARKLTDRATQLAAMPIGQREQYKGEASALLSELRSLARKYRSIGLHRNFQRAARKLINTYQPPKKRDRATEKLNRVIKKQMGA